MASLPRAAAGPARSEASSSIGGTGTRRTQARIERADGVDAVPDGPIATDGRLQQGGNEDVSLLGDHAHAVGDEPHPASINDKASQIERAPDAHTASRRGDDPLFAGAAAPRTEAKVCIVGR